jgi:hypothetical protein
MPLTEHDAALIKGMLARGDKQQDIAAWFGVNSGRVAETRKGQRFALVPPAPPHLLPPPGPYRLGPASEEPTGNVTAQEVRAVLSAFEERIAAELARMTAERRQTNEKVDLLMRQQRELRVLLGALERPQTPRIGRRRPLGHD